MHNSTRSPCPQLHVSSQKSTAMRKESHSANTHSLPACTCHTSKALSISGVGVGVEGLERRRWAPNHSRGDATAFSAGRSEDRPGRLRACATATHDRHSRLLPSLRCLRRHPRPVLSRRGPGTVAKRAALPSTGALARSQPGRRVRLVVALGRLLLLGLLPPFLLLPLAAFFEP